MAPLLQKMIEPMRPVLDCNGSSLDGSSVGVDENYRVVLRRGVVQPRSGVWLLDRFQNWDSPSSNDEFAYVAVKIERVLKSILKQADPSWKNKQQMQTSVL